METCDPTATLPLDPTDSGIVHMVEFDVRRRLLARDDVEFRSLVVRRVPGGICLEGVVERRDNLGAIVAEVIREIDGIENVYDHLVVQDSGPPAKG